MSNPFKREEPHNYREYIRNLFDGKKPGDSFIVEMFSKKKVEVRATIYMTAKQKYKTKFSDGKMYVLILDGERTNVTP